MRFTKEIVKVLDKFPEVSWDRYTGDPDSICRIFGWIDCKQGESPDFLILDIEDGIVYDLITSADEKYEDFFKRLGRKLSESNRDMADYFGNAVRIANISERRGKKRYDEVTIPITYQFNKRERVGRMKIKKDWFHKITPQHKFLIEGRFTNNNLYKAIQITLI